MSQLLPLLAGLVIFLSSHALPRWFGLRETMVEKMGQGPYRVLYSLASLGGLALVIYGYGHYRAQGYIPLWAVPRFFNHIAILLLWPAMILVAAAWLPGAISAKAKHPLLAAVKLWALVHLILNGDLGSILLFGAFLALAVITRVRLGRLATGEALPGASTVPSTKNDVIAVLLGTLFTLAMVMGLHRMLIGVPVL
jgi:uncharacterized membrane protein